MKKESIRERTASTQRPLAPVLGETRAKDLFLPQGLPKPPPPTHITQISRHYGDHHRSKKRTVPFSPASLSSRLTNLLPAFPSMDSHTPIPTQDKRASARTERSGLSATKPQVKLGKARGREKVWVFPELSTGFEQRKQRRRLETKEKKKEQKKKRRGYFGLRPVSKSCCFPCY